MPRVPLSANQKKVYKLKDLYAWIEGKRSIKDITQADMGKVLDVSQTAVSARLLGLKRGKDSLKCGELMLLFKELEASDDEILKFIKI